MSVVGVWVVEGVVVEVVDLDSVVVVVVVSSIHLSEEGKCVSGGFLLEVVFSYYGRDS